jgi:hypothetical protein
MTEKCFDEGTIQAFLDGELPTDLLEMVARHTAICANCSMLLVQAEEESAFAFSALDTEFNSLVPTERIRTNLYEAISQIEKPRKSVWTRIFGGGFSFSNPSIVAFASLVLVVGLFTVLFINRETQNPGGNEIAGGNLPNPNVVAVNNPPVQNAPVNSGDEANNTDSNNTQKDKTVIVPPVYRPIVTEQATIQKANYKPEKSSVEDRSQRIEARNSADNRQLTNNGSVLLGEESYIKTIATLTESVNSRKDSVMRPSERVAFESDLAVVDDAIAKMRKEIRRNPKNEAAKQVLRSSYQSKIDLLNSVAEKTELMATLR